MDIRRNVSLRDYSTMRLGGLAAYLVSVKNKEEVQQAVTWAEERNLPVMMIGGGSNIIWRDEGFAGLVVVSKVEGYSQKQDGEEYVITVGSGENWDSVVARTTKEGLAGIECLSLIPGTAGATPVQNVGAYGQEIAQTLISLDAYDRQTRQIVTISKADCNFGYRTSRFKTVDHGRFFIISITLRLKHNKPEPPFYNALQAYLDQNNIHEYTPQTLRHAVIAIRKSKLPDPAKVANNGSFFANPVISRQDFEKLQSKYQDVPHWPAGEDQFKIPAAWLLEQAGFKDMHDPETGMGTWPMQPLVLVNEHAQSTAQLIKFRQKILDSIKQKFDITLQQEPELLP